jgi:FlaG/FlaF family flagellin (archaellin)
MVQMISDKRAISAVLSTLLFVTIILGAAILLYNLVSGDIENFMESSSAQPFKLFIGNVGFNQTCITIHIINSGERDAIIDKVYINKEPRAFNLLDHDLRISANTGKEIYIFGSYIDGCSFEIKVIFESGYSLYTMERY